MIRLKKELSFSSSKAAAAHDPEVALLLLCAVVTTTTQETRAALEVPLLPDGPETAGTRCRPARCELEGVLIDNRLCCRSVGFGSGSGS
eukprot:COSAG04_NODE_29974_length_265_cov_0.933735_1_plen_88_part_11